MRINKQNRDEIQYRYLERLANRMNRPLLIEHVISSLEVDYNHYTDEELENEISDFFEDFEWEVD